LALVRGAGLGGGGGRGFGGGVGWGVVSAKDADGEVPLPSKKFSCSPLFPRNGRQEEDGAFSAVLP